MLLKCSKEKSHCSSHLSRMLVKACVQYVDFDEYTCTQTHRPTTARALCAQPTHPNACTHTHTNTHTHIPTHAQTHTCMCTETYAPTHISDDLNRCTLIICLSALQRDKMVSM